MKAKINNKFSDQDFIELAKIIRKLCDLKIPIDYYHTLPNNTDNYDQSSSKDKLEQQHMYSYKIKPEFLEAAKQNIKKMSANGINKKNKHMIEKYLNLDMLNVQTRMEFLQKSIKKNYTIASSLSIIASIISLMRMVMLLIMKISDIGSNSPNIVLSKLIMNILSITTIILVLTVSYLNIQNSQSKNIENDFLKLYIIEIAKQKEIQKRINYFLKEDHTAQEKNKINKLFTKESLKVEKSGYQYLLHRFQNLKNKTKSLESKILSHISKNKNKLNKIELIGLVITLTTLVTSFSFAVLAIYDPYKILKINIGKLKLEDFVDLIFISIGIVLCITTVYIKLQNKKQNTVNTEPNTTNHNIDNTNINKEEKDNKKSKFDSAKEYGFISLINTLIVTSLFVTSILESKGVISLFSNTFPGGFPISNAIKVLTSTAMILLISIPNLMNSYKSFEDLSFVTMNEENNAVCTNISEVNASSVETQKGIASVIEEST